MSEEVAGEELQEEVVPEVVASEDEESSVEGSRDYEGDIAAIRRVQAAKRPREP